MESGLRGLGADGPYWEALARGALVLPRCAACGEWHWPAPFRCADCGSWEMAWVPTAMTGRLYSWTRTWHVFDGVEALGSPYVSVLVELPQAGGIRLMGLAADAGPQRIGAAVAGATAVARVYGHDVPAIRWAGTNA